MLPEDTVLTPPVPASTILGTVTGYEISSGCPLPSPSFCQAPIYTSYDRNTPAWWDILVDEHLLSRVNVVVPLGPLTLLRLPSASYDRLIVLPFASIIFVVRPLPSK